MAKQKTPTQRARAKRDNSEQSKRFIEAAEKVGADQEPGALERAFDRVVKPSETKASKNPVR